MTDKEGPIQKRKPSRNPVSKRGKNSDKRRISRKALRLPSDTGEMPGGLPNKKGGRKR